MEEKKIPVFAISGGKKTGKTTLATEVIERLGSTDYRIASIKHTTGEYSIDKEDTDTWKHAEAGSELVVFSTAVETSFIYTDKMELEQIVELISSFGYYDIVIIEGFKDADIPNITLQKDIGEASDILDDQIEDMIDSIEREINIYKIYNKLPMLDCGDCGYDGCREFAEAVLDGDEKLSNCVSISSKSTIQIEVNGKEIPLTPFPSNIIKNGIKGMLSSLKGVDDIREVDIHFEEDSD